METCYELPCPALPKLAARPADSHKGNFGQALLIGGSRGMSGAIAMAGLAALRTGAGLVSLAVADRCLDTVAGVSPCLMTIPLAEDTNGRISIGAFNQLEPWMERATCIAVGPGMGRSRDLQGLLGKLLRVAQCPLVIDADGLNNLAESGWWVSSKNAARPLVLTPHPGEWSRISGVDANDRNLQCRSAIEFAKLLGQTTIALKGHRTLVTDGYSAVLNSTGTPAMAIGGSGDVLTGIIMALICQGLSPRDAAHLGVHVHGQAAEMAQHSLGTHVILPTELIEHIGRALQTHIAS